MVTCPKCRSPVDVPDDCYDATIRCAICWAVVAIAPRDRPVTAAMLLDDAPAAPPKGDPFAAISGRPAKGMTPLEDLLRRVSEREPTLLLAGEVPLAVEVPKVATPTVTKPRKPRPDDDDIRRKRGAARASSSVTTTPPPEIQGMHRSNALLIVGVTLLLFAVAFVMAKQFLK